MQLLPASNIYYLRRDDTATSGEWIDLVLDSDIEVTNQHILQGVREIMAQIDDLNAAVASAQQAVNDLMARDAQVVAGVQALQAEVSNLQAQVAANQPPDLSGVTTAVNQLAATVATVDTESTADPAAQPAPATPVATDTSAQPTDQPVQ